MSKEQFVDANFRFHKELEVAIDRIIENQSNAVFGMTTGTKHDKGHLDRVGDIVVKLIGQEVFSKLKPEEKAVYGLCAYCHDIGLRKGREIHARVENIFSEMQRLIYQENTENFWIKKEDIYALSVIAAAHSGKSTLQALEHFNSGRMFVFGNEIKLAEVASVIRIADEFDEGPDRFVYHIYEDEENKATALADSQGLTSKPYSITWAYHSMSRMIRINNVGNDEVMIRVLANPDELNAAYYDKPHHHPPRGKGLLYKFITTFLLKKANELGYCIKHFPESVKAKRISVSMCNELGKEYCSADLIEPENDIWKLFHNEKGELLFIVPEMSREFCITTKEEMLESLRNTIAESYLGLYGDKLKGLVLFGSVAEGNIESDLDICAIIDYENMKDPPPNALSHLVIKYWEDVFGRPISIDTLTPEQALSRFSLGEPLMSTIAAEGACLIESELHFNMKILGNQKLEFPLRRLLKIMIHMLEVEYEELISNKARENEWNFVKSAYRAICLCRQISHLASFNKETISIRESIELSKISKNENILQEYYSKEDLREFQHVVAVFKARDLSDFTFERCKDACDRWWEITESSIKLMNGRD